jgi:hypothetical protein
MKITIKKEGFPVFYLLVPPLDPFGGKVSRDTRFT